MTDTEFDYMAVKPRKWANLTTKSYYIRKQAFIIYNSQASSAEWLQGAGLQASSGFPSASAAFPLKTLN